MQVSTFGGEEGLAHGEVGSRGRYSHLLRQTRQPVRVRFWPGCLEEPLPLLFPVALGVLPLAASLGCGLGGEARGYDMAESGGRWERLRDVCCFSG
jgi:hypothetical protein